MGTVLGTIVGAIVMGILVFVMKQRQGSWILRLSKL